MKYIPISICILLAGCQSSDYSASDVDNISMGSTGELYGYQVDVSDTDKYMFVKNNKDDVIQVKIREVVEKQPRNWIEKMENCPLDTVRECLVWLRKEPVKETLYLEDNIKYNDVNYVIEYDENISGQKKELKGLVERYKLLLKLSRVCCVENILNQMDIMNIDKNLIYKFLEDDAMFYNLGSRCIFTNSNKNIDVEKINMIELAENAKRSCVCKNAKKIQEVIKPFDRVYAENPKFMDKVFVVSITDGLNRTNQYDINYDIKNIKRQLQSCVK